VWRAGCKEFRGGGDIVVRGDPFAGPSAAGGDGPAGHLREMGVDVRLNLAAWGSG